MKGGREVRLPCVRLGEGLGSGRASRRPSSTAHSSSLYRDHLRDVYSYSYYRVGNHHDAEDVTEQAFLQAYRHFERARRESNGRPLRPWLIRIAHNLASNYHRDRARRPQRVLEDERAARRAARHRADRRGAGGAEARDGPPPASSRRPPRRADHALRARHGQPRDRPGPGPLGRGHQGSDPPRDQAARGGDERRMAAEPPRTSRACCATALRPIEPPENLSGRRRGDPERGHRGRRRGALGMGGGALGVRAPLAARSRATGFAPRPRSRRAGSRQAAWCSWSCAAAAASGRHASPGSRGSGLGDRGPGPGPGSTERLVRPQLAAGAPADRAARRTAITPVIPRIRCRTLSSLLTGTSLSRVSFSATNPIPLLLVAMKPRTQRTM